MTKRFFLILAAFVVIFIGILITTKHKADAPTTGSSSAAASNHVKGDGKKGVVLIEYGDLQCPACWGYEPLVKQVFDKYKTDITFQFRNYPLTSLHPNAFAAHRAVEAADKQGKFWEMHDMLFEHAHQQDSSGHVTDIEWTATTNPTTFFDDYAQQLGLNVDKFNQDMKSDAVNAVINADLDIGKGLGFTGTPSFLLDGKQIDNPRDLDAFSKLIDAEIAAKNK